ncbi:MAG: hypothetical protein U0531_15490 [Dehalococcoidia bacterium]
MLGFVQVYGLTETLALPHHRQPAWPHQQGYPDDERIRIQDRAGGEMIGVSSPRG